MQVREEIFFEVVILLRHASLLVKSFFTSLWWVQRQNRGWHWGEYILEFPWLRNPYPEKMETISSCAGLTNLKNVCDSKFVIASVLTENNKLSFAVVGFFKMAKQRVLDPRQHLEQRIRTKRTKLTGEMVSLARSPTDILVKPLSHPAMTWNDRIWIISEEKFHSKVFN